MINIPFVANLTAFWFLYNLTIWYLQVLLILLRLNITSLSIHLQRKPAGKRFLTKLSVHFGCRLYPLQIQWTSSRFNRPMLQMLNSMRLITWRRWFAVGSSITCLTTAVAVVFLSFILLNTLWKLWTKSSELSSVDSQNRNALVPLIPGVNLPINQVVYVLISLFICTVIHELGHALSALSDQAKLNGIGCFLFVIYPGAFVDIESESLNKLSPSQQLRIYCGGVWHNIVLCVCAVFLLFALPIFIWSFMFSLNNGIVVTDVATDSPIAGEKGLMIGDELTFINDCQISNTSMWRHCIHKSTSEPQIGFCYTSPTVLDDSCCSDNATLSARKACFLFRLDDRHRQSCLYVNTLANGDQFCRSNYDCQTKVPRLRDFFNLDGRNNRSNLCFFPKADVTTRFLVVSRRNKYPLLFFGYPSDLHLFGQFR